MTIYQTHLHKDFNYYDAWEYQGKLFACRKRTVEWLNKVGRNLDSMENVEFEIRVPTQEEVDRGSPNVFRVDIESSNGAMLLVAVHIPNAQVKYTDVYDRLRHAILEELDVADPLIHCGDMHWDEFLLRVDEAYIWIDVRNYDE